MRNLILQELFEKFLGETMTPDEIILLQNYVQDENNQELLDKLLESAYTNKALSIKGDFNPDEVFGELILKIQSAHATIEPLASSLSPVRHILFFQRWWWAAASILLIAAAGAYFWLNKTQPQIAVTNIRKQFINDVAPGGNKAVLTLANGTKIVLDSIANGMLAQEGNAKIVKLANGQIAYTSIGATGNEILYNTMSTPRGGQYKLILPDGSKVWLNAASSLRYPLAFTGKERIVEMTGEAYFEVVHNAQQPFRVKVAGQEIEDLGTAFNVNAYTDEQVIRTTLLEGAIKIRTSVLQPGQQADVDKSNNAIIVLKADTEAAVAWKNGYFSFKDAGVQTIMQQLSRWYDVTVEYKVNVPHQQFTGEIGRTLSLADVLDILKKTGVHFEIGQDRRIMIMP